MALGPQAIDQHDNRGIEYLQAAFKSDSAIIGLGRSLDLQAIFPRLERNLSVVNAGLSECDRADLKGALGAAQGIL